MKFDNIINVEKLSSDDSKKVLLKSPTDSLPLLQIGDHFLSGTKAILKYILSTSKEVQDHFLHSKCSFESSAVEMWVDYTVNNIWITIEALSCENQQIVEEAKKDLHIALGKISKQLQFQTYLVGNSLSLADIFLACSVRSVVATLKTEDLKALSNLVRWYKLISNLKEFREIYGDNQISSD